MSVCFIVSVDLLHSLRSCPWRMRLVLCSDYFWSIWRVRGSVHHGRRELCHARDCVVHDS